MSRSNFGTVYSQSVTSAATLFTLDVGDMDSVGVQVTSPGTTCVISYEACSEAVPVNWRAVSGYDNGAGANPSYAATTGVAGFLLFPVQGVKWFRARVSTYTSGTVTAVAVNSEGPAQRTSVALASGVNTIGSVFGNASATSNNASKFRLLSAATANATIVKAAGGKVVGGSVSNMTAAFKFVRFFDKASLPVMGTDAPTWVVPVPPNSTIGLHDLFGLIGLYLPAGISIAITGASADLDATAVAVGDVQVNLNWV